MPGYRYAWTILVLAACVQPSIGLQRGAGDFEAERVHMVAEQLEGRDIRSSRVLDAVRKVPRHLFVPESRRAQAYADSPLPIGYEQTISQPYIVAFMTQGLDVQPDHSVLEIGTGSGYQAAVLILLAGRVYTIEIIAPLAERARGTLATLGYRNIEVRTGNGYLGWPEHAPYDRIMVTAAPDGSLQVRTTGNQGSGVLSSMVQANGLIVLHHAQGNVAVGDEVDVMMFDGAI